MHFPPKALGQEPCQKLSLIIEEKDNNISQLLAMFPKKRGIFNFFHEVFFSVTLYLSYESVPNV